MSIVNLTDYGNYVIVLSFNSVWAFIFEVFAIFVIANLLGSLLLDFVKWVIGYERNTDFGLPDVTTAVKMPSVKQSTFPVGRIIKEGEKP